MIKRYRTNVGLRLAQEQAEREWQRRRFQLALLAGAVAWLFMQLIRR